MTFQDFQLNPRVVAGIPEAFVEPTPIQTESIPLILQGKDVLGLAQTGTGKTAAFALPMLSKLVDGPRKKVRALILAPTRELADQIYESVRTFGARTNLTVTTVYGGVSMYGQIERLKRGVDIVVACPGRLLDHVQRRTISLTDVEYLVLDEADHMFDMGFLPTVRRILQSLPKTRQTLLFSATMPEEVSSLANDVLTDPVRVQVGKGAALRTIEHTLYPVDEGKKSALLLKLLQETGSGSVLIFARTKQRTKRLCETLQQQNFSVTSLQGNLSQQRRQSAMKGFRDGRYQILVATDIAARGIDIASVTHVINYDMPMTVEAYTHRIGRTGRAERTGDAFTFVTHADEWMVRSIERTLRREIERRNVEGFERSERQHRSERPQRPGFRFGGRSSGGGPRGSRRGGQGSSRGPRREGPFRSHNRGPRGDRAQSEARF